MKRAICLLLLAFTTALAAGACSSVDSEATTRADCPSLTDFQSVSPVVEQRCGTLDCHGNIARPMRIFSQNGLRKEFYDGTPQNRPGGAATTMDEIHDNWAAICGLEPEIMTTVVASHALDPSIADDLTFIRKPLLLEKHKGGRIWNTGDPGIQCLVNWVIGAKASTYTPLCTQELE